MTPAEFCTWLEDVQATKPFTMEDGCALHAMIKPMMPGYAVDVTWADDVVRVRLYAIAQPLTVAFARDIVLS